MEVPWIRSTIRPLRSQSRLLAGEYLGARMDQHSDTDRIHLRGMANPEILVPLHLPGRGHHGSLPEEQPTRNAQGPYQVLKLQRMRDRMSYADPNLGLGLEKVQRLGMHPLHGMHRCMPRWSALAKVPIESSGLVSVQAWVVL